MAPTPKSLRSRSLEQRLAELNPPRPGRAATLDDAALADAVRQGWLSLPFAQPLAEDRAPPPELWREQLVSSRLLEYEVWVLVHARALMESHGDPVRTLLDRVALATYDRRMREAAKALGLPLYSGAA